MRAHGHRARRGQRHRAQYQASTNARRKYLRDKARYQNANGCTDSDAANQLADRLYAEPAVTQQRAELGEHACVTNIKDDRPRTDDE